MDRGASLASRPTTRFGRTADLSGGGEFVQQLADEEGLARTCCQGKQGPIAAAPDFFESRSDRGVLVIAPAGLTTVIGLEEWSAAPGP
jgi:hypothetical protein